MRTLKDSLLYLLVSVSNPSNAMKWKRDYISIEASGFLIRSSTCVNNLFKIDEDLETATITPLTTLALPRSVSIVKQVRNRPRRFIYRCGTCAHSLRTVSPFSTAVWVCRPLVFCARLIALDKRLTRVRHSIRRRRVLGIRCNHVGRFLSALLNTHWTESF